MPPLARLRAWEEEREEAVVENPQRVWIDKKPARARHQIDSEREKDHHELTTTTD